MSLSFPTVRKAKHDGTLPEWEPERQQRKRISRKHVMFAACAMIVGIALSLLHMIQTGTTRPKVIASVPGGELRASCDSGFVIARDGSLIFLDTDGITGPLPGDYETVINSGAWLVGLEPPFMHLIRPDLPGSQVLTVRLAPGERPVPVLQGDAVITYRPQQDIKFGEPWYLRAVSGEGAVMWDRQLPYAPLFGTSDGRHLVMAAVDISGGGTPWALCVSINTGELMWQQPLGPGAWRYLAISPDGNVRAVLDSCAYCLTADGQVAWAYRPAGMIASAAEHSGILAVSVSNEPSGARTGLFGNAQVMALSKDGEVLWDMKTTEALPRLFVSAGRLIVLEAGKVLCVQPDTGDVFFWAKVDGYPITCAKDVILVYKDDGFALVDPGISSP